MLNVRLIPWMTTVMLPALKTGIMLIVLALPVMAGVDSVVSPDGQKPDSNRRVETDRLFKDLMTTLPADAKKQVDSVRAVRRPSVSTEGSGQGSRTVTATVPTASTDVALRGLSPQLQQQVQDAMSEIQHRQEMRRLEFRDTKPCRQCPGNN